MNAKIICGFPGIGKSHAFNELRGEYVVLDSDSSNFSWVSDGVRNDYFPKNYIEHIKENCNKADFIFVSTHKEVLEELSKEQLDFCVICPPLELKEEYLDRYRHRGSPKSFIEMLDKNFHNFIKGLEKHNPIYIQKGEYLLDVIKKRA